MLQRYEATAFMKTLSSLPKLTVITVTKNDSIGLRKTMKSVMTSDCFWIVIDGSDREDLLRKNRDICELRQCRYIESDDSGIFDAMNKGLDLAKTPLVLFLNGGDQLAFPQVVYDIRASYFFYKWKWAVGQSIAIDDNGMFKWFWPIPSCNSIRFKLSLRSLPHQSTVYETKFLRELGGFRIDSIYSDWITALKASKYHSAFFSSQVWSFFLTGGISSKQTIRFWWRECHRLRKLEKQLIFNRLFDFSLQTVLAVLLLIDRRSKMLHRPDLSGNENFD